MLGAAGYHGVTTGGTAQLINEVLARTSLRDILLPVGAAASTAGMSTLEVQTAALAASVRAIEQMLPALVAQRSGAGLNLGRLALVAVPLVVGSACYFGWAQFGWVSLGQLNAGLSHVRQVVETSVAELRESMSAGFERVDAMFAEVKADLLQLSVGQEDLKADVQANSTELRALNERMTPVERNSATAAQGVEVLCELVKTSGLLANASGESLRRLDDFTGSTRQGTSATLLQPAPALAAPLSPLEQGAQGYPMQMSPSFGQAAPTFMRALIS